MTISRRTEELTEIWKGILDQPILPGSTRQRLIRATERFTATIDQPWYNSEDVLTEADELLDVFEEENLTYIDDASVHSLDSLENSIKKKLEYDTSNPVDHAEVTEFIENSIDNEELEDRLSSSFYDHHRIKSMLYDDISELSKKEAKNQWNYLQ